MRKTANVKQNPSAKAYENAIYDEARKKGFRLTNVTVDLENKYAVATDASGYHYKVKLLPKSVGKFGSWRAVKNPTSRELNKCKKLIDEERESYGVPTIGRRERNGRKNGSTGARSGNSDVRSPTRTATSTEAHTSGNVTVTGGAGAGATTRVTIHKNPLGKRVPSQGKMLARLRGKFKAYGYTTAGMKSWRLPADQLTANELELAEDHPSFFEVEKGYVFLSKPTRRNSTKKNPEIMGRYVSEAVLDNVFQQLTQYYQSSVKDKKTGLPNMVRYLELKVGLLPRQAKAYIGVMEKHLTPRRNTKRNSKSGSVFNEEKIDSFSAMFQGKVNGKEMETVGSDLTPPITARLGKLVLLKIKNGRDEYDINFKGDAWLAADARSNLYVLGRNGRINNIVLPKKGNMIHVGKVAQVNYVTNKSHIENGRTVEYYHSFGEVDGVLPDLHIDHNGFPVFSGGNYVIGTHGVEN